MPKIGWVISGRVCGISVDFEPGRSAACKSQSSFCGSTRQQKRPVGETDFVREEFENGSEDILGTTTIFANRRKMEAAWDLIFSYFILYGIATKGVSQKRNINNPAPSPPN